MTQFLLAGLLLATLCPQGLRASEEVLAAAGYAFPSIQQEGSARAIALGSTYVGIAEGSSSLMWNPAGLGALKAPEISLHHNSAILGAVQEMGVLGLPLGNGNGMGISLNFEDNGVFNGRDSGGLSTGDYSARAYGGSLGWGFGGPAGVFMGLTLKMNHRDLAGTGDNAFAGDVGALWALNPSISVGGAYTNLGPDVDGRQIAQGMRLGLSAYADKGSDFEWLFALSGEALTFGDQGAHFGVEHTIHKFLSLRTGYSLAVPNPEIAGLLGWTFGGGIAFNHITLDYAFVPLAELGAMQRVSLTYAFNDGPKPAATPVATPAATPIAAPAPTLLAAAPVPVATPVAPVETVLILTDEDFKRVVPGGEAELLSAAAIGRLDRALAATLGDAKYLRVIGETKIAGAGDEMREVGGRRANLVRDYLVKKAPPTRVVKAVTGGDRDGALSGIFQVVVR